MLIIALSIQMNEYHLFVEVANTLVDRRLFEKIFNLLHFINYFKN